MICYSYTCNKLVTAYYKCELEIMSKFPDVMNTAVWYPINEENQPHFCDICRVRCSHHLFYFKYLDLLTHIVSLD